jgi:hypothetical protein
MAEHNDHAPAPNSAMDYSEHQKTYALFGWLVKWSVIGIVVVLLLMLAFCTPH